ncbi:class I SAM-dependent methyltransferase [Halieaceae bacterium IMCC14734]|uniref:Class I SAM-dependent methyltransferase n=2 Tax=Candidatus Litorirhabdus singularis TaxID=2518993 RepID=A0ABT3TLR7_9GAMM|nr:class I SAM-dependent methyltransferase [Candidatus Litorirhabdus singularis]
MSPWTHFSRKPLNYTREKTGIMSQEKNFTPALGYTALTPIYDLAVRALTREETWRSELLEQIRPSQSDRILDVGCGTGSLAIRMKKINTECEVHGIDPDAAILTRARKKANAANVDITFHNGFLHPNMLAQLGRFSKIVSSLVFHQTALDSKRDILESTRKLLLPGGKLYVADYGLQRTPLMRTLFRCTVQAIDGVKDTQHNANGCMPELVATSGFTSIAEARVIPTPTGSISIYTAIRP